MICYGRKGLWTVGRFIHRQMKMMTGTGSEKCVRNLLETED